jgi:hypothetical protein
VVFKGLRVRMGVHTGTPKMVRDPMTRRVEYIGPVVNAAARITALAHGGQVLISEAAHAKQLALSTSATTTDAAPSPAEDKPARKGKKPRKKLLALGKFEMPDSPQGSESCAPLGVVVMLTCIQSALYRSEAVRDED